MKIDEKYDLKHNEAEARERIRAFWRGSSLGRPVLLISAKKPEFKWTQWAGPVLTCKEKDLSPEWQAHFASNCIESCAYFAEAMPGYTIRYDSHIPLLAVLSGGNFEYAAEEATLKFWGDAHAAEDEGADFWGGTGWINPWPEVFEHPLPRFELSHPVVEGLTAAIHRCAEKVGNQGIISQPCWTDALTTLGALRTESQLGIDLIERPEKVKEWTHAATSLILEASEHFYLAGKSHGCDESLSWLGLLAEGRMDAVQCDFSIMLSPEMFDEFVIPNLRRHTDYLDYAVYHLDGGANMRFIDQLAALPKLNAIQYTRIAGSEYPGAVLNDYRTIREHGLSIFAFCETVGEAVDAVRAVGPDGLALALPPFETISQAEDAIQQIEKAC